MAEETGLQPFLDQGPDFDSFSRKRIRALIIYDVKTINFITTFQVTGVKSNANPVYQQAVKTRS